MGLARRRGADRCSSLAFAAGCGGDSDSDSTSGIERACPPRSARARARSTSICLGRLRRGRVHRPERRLGHAVRAGDRLPGQRQGRRHLRRDGPADADRRVRRCLGFRRRHAAADRRRRRRAGQHRSRPQLRRRSSRTSRTSPTTRSTVRSTASRTVAGANLLMSNTDDVKPTPTSWGAVFDPSGGGQVQGQGQAYDGPIYIADAARVPEGAPARPGDHEPLRAGRGAVQRRGRPAQGAARRTSASTGRTTPRQISAFANGDGRSARRWQYQTSCCRADGKPVDGRASPTRVRPVGRTPG